MKKQASVRWLVLPAAFLFLLPLLIAALDRQADLALMIGLGSLLLSPILCLVSALMAAKKGVPALLACLPCPVALVAGHLLAGLPLPGHPVLLAFALAVLGAAIGQEILRRKGKPS